MNLNKFILFLEQIDGIGDASIRKLINNNCFANLKFENLDDILSWLNANEKYFSKKSNIKSLRIEDLVKANKVRKILELELEKNEINYLSYFDSKYPERFKYMVESNDYPILLFYKGDLSLLKNEKLYSIIGTRKPTDVAVKICNNITIDSVMEEATIVSGLALGCDSIAHSKCLEINGKTIAIIGSSLDKIYPKTNVSLANKIISNGGLILSEYPINFPGQAFSFVQRDRLVAAVSDKTIVIQTSSNGGTMHAAKACINKYHKQLNVVSPESLHFSDCDGNKYLIDNLDCITLCNYN